MKVAGYPALSIASLLEIGVSLSTLDLVERNDRSQAGAMTEKLDLIKMIKRRTMFSTLGII